MTLRHLEIFIVVCRTMSMTGAAEILNMTQPAVSKAVSELESFYHVKLFDRLNRRIYLTEAGESLRRYSEEIIARFDESISFLRDSSSFFRCRLAVNVSVGETVLADLIQFIGGKMPDIDLSVSVHNSSTIRKMLHENACDIAVIDSPDDPDLESVPLFRETLRLYCTDACIPERSVSLDLLRQKQFLLREAGSGMRRCIEPLLHNLHCSPDQITESISNDVLLQMCLNGSGLVLLSDRYLKKHRISGLHPVEIADHTFIRSYSLVSLRGKYLNNAVTRCMKVLPEYFSGI